MEQWHSKIIVEEVDKVLKSRKGNNISTISFIWLEQSCEDYVATSLHLIIVLLWSLYNDGVEDDKDGVLKVLVPLGEQVQYFLRALWNGLRLVDGDGQFTNDQLEESKFHCI